MVQFGAIKGSHVEIHLMNCTNSCTCTAGFCCKLQWC